MNLALVSFFGPVGLLNCLTEFLFSVTPYIVYKQLLPRLFGGSAVLFQWRLYYILMHSGGAFLTVVYHDPTVLYLEGIFFRVLF